MQELHKSLYTNDSIQTPLSYLPLVTVLVPTYLSTGLFYTDYSLLILSLLTPLVVKLMVCQYQYG